METETLMLRNIRPRLKGKIARRVASEGTNMNDVLVAILADTYGIAFFPSGVRRLSVGKSSQALLTMPAELKQAIEEDAHANDDSMMNIVLEILCGEFGETFRPTSRWPAKA